MTDLVEILTDQFERLEAGWFDLIEQIPDDKLFSASNGPVSAKAQRSTASLIVRSAARVEQAFGGLTVRLWDDPFEWTLPETIATRARLVDYLKEVRALRRKGMALCPTDEVLYRRIPAPERLCTIAEVLVTALLDAAELHGKALLSAQDVTAC